jgi:hypothetical protein
MAVALLTAVRLYWVELPYLRLAADTVRHSNVPARPLQHRQPTGRLFPARWLTWPTSHDVTTILK